MAPAGTTRLTVVVPTYRRPELLRRCLDSLRDQSVAAAEFEVAVVDDASPDASPEVLRAAAAHMPNLVWESQPANRGPAAARNRAVGMSTAPLLLFMDDDVVAAPDLVATHLRLHEGAPTTHGVVGLVEWLPELEVTPFMHWLDGTNLQFAFHTWLQPGPLAHPSDAFYTCNLSLHREIFDAAGGFDERFPYPAYEDIELGVRLARLGFVLHYDPQALGWHARAITLEEFRARMSKVAESAVLLRASHPELDVDVDGPGAAGRPASVRRLLGLAQRVTPRLFGRDLRSAYFWSEVGAAWQRGLITAAQRVGV